MRSVNLPSGAERNVNAGHVWEEVLTNVAGSVNLKPQQTFRIRAVGTTSVTIDGVLAMTMAAGEIEYLNAGSGIPGDGRTCVEITVDAAVFMQISKVVDPGRRTR